MGLTVDRGTIEHILRNEAILRELPALRVFLQRRERASACCGKKQASHTSATHIRQAKISLMGLPPDKMKRLKALLNTDELIFHLPSRTGIVTKRL